LISFDSDKIVAVFIAIYLPTNLNLNCM